MVKAKVRVMERCSSLCYKESTFSSLETSLLMMSLPVMLASKSAAFLLKQKKIPVCFGSPLCNDNNEGYQTLLMRFGRTDELKYWPVDEVTLSY